jgi:RHS repeat-associated protein
MRTRARSIPYLHSLLVVGILLAPTTTLAGDEIFGPQVCRRGTGAPTVFQYSFPAAEPDRGYVLKVFNGGLEDTLFEQVSSSVITLNGVEVLGPNNFSQLVSYLEVPVALQPQQNTLRVEVRGKPGGALVIKIYPSVVIDYPSEGRAFATTAVPVTGRLYAAATAIDVNGVPGTVSGTNFSVNNVPLAEGNNVLTATAGGSGALSGHDSVVVTRDTTPPAIVVTSPQDGATVSIPSIDIVGSVNDPGATVLVNGSAVALVDFSFIVRGFELGAGTNTIPIEARDALGNSSMLAVHATYAPPAPTAALTASSGQIPAGGSSVLNWTTSGATAVSIAPDIGPVAAGGSLTVSPAATTTYLLTAIGPGGNTTAQVTVAVSSPPPMEGCPGCPPGWFEPPTATLTASPEPGGGATLTWLATGAEWCRIDGGVGVVPCNGSQRVIPVATTSYTMTASGPGGVSTATVVVTATYPAPTAHLEAGPAAVLPGGPSTLSWTSTNADTCSIDGIGAVACIGSLVVHPGETATYTLRVSGGGGAESSTVVVVVMPPAPTASVAAAPSAILPGETSTLSWVSTNADSCFISGIGAIACTGSISVQPEKTTFYTLRASGPGGEVSISATITVVSPPPTAVLSADPPSILLGSSATLSWTSTNADRCSIDGIGAVAFTGSMSVSPSTTTSYTLRVRGPGGVVTSTATLVVTYPVPTARLTAVPAVVLQGGASLLTWASTGAYSCSISGVGAVGCNGSMPVRPSATTHYTFTASGLSGEASATAAVAVEYPVPTVILSAAPATIIDGQSATLNWSSTGAISAEINQGIGSVPAAGSLAVTPTASTTYTITVVGPGGAATSFASVTVFDGECFDADGDRFSSSGKCGPADCNDVDPAIHPGAVEIPGDAVDQDCDGQDLMPILADNDGDLFAPVQGDCDDNNPGVFPGATDFPGNGVDEDCNGSDTVAPSLADMDHDGHSAVEGDCDDTNPQSHPEAMEIPCNGIDEDCDGEDACDLEPVETARSGFIHGNVFDARTGNPITGAEVKVGRVGKLVTDEAGKFIFPTPDEGVYVVLVEKAGYTFAQKRVAVRSAVHSAVDPVFLVPLDPVTETILPGEGGTLINSTGEVELLFEPNAVASPIEVSATRFREPEELPGALPESSHFTMAVDLKPDGVTFRKPVRLRIENTHRFAPATPVPAGYYRKDLGSWVPDGMAKVTADGRWVEYWVTHFTPFDLNVPPNDLPPGAERPEVGADQSDERNVPMLPCQAGNTDNCRVVYHSGNLMEDYELPSFRSLGRPTAVRLVYASDTASPKAAIATNYNLELTETAAAPETTELKVSVAGRLASAHFTGTAGRLRQAYLFDAKDSAGNYLRTGAYPYHIALSNWYPAYYGTARVFGGPAVGLIQDAAGNPLRAPWDRPLTREYSGQVIVNNLTGSHFGAGWNIDGISRLHLSQPQGAVLIEGNGAKRHYAANIISTVAGKGGGYSGDGGPAVDATMDGPAGISIDGRGNLFFADVGNSRIRKVDPDGFITTVAGNGQNACSGDGGPALEAAIGYPQSVAVDVAGNLYIADAQCNRIRKVTPNGHISTFAGNGERPFNGDNIPAIGAGIDAPYGIAVDKAGNVMFTDSGNSRVRKIDSRGIVTTVAGNGEQGFSGDGGPALQAALHGPTMIAIDDGGALYVADFQNYRVRKIDAAGKITTIAGNGENPWTVTGDGGPATEASLGRPMSLALDDSGGLLIGIHENRVRRVDANGIITTVAGNGVRDIGPDGIPATDSSLCSVSGLALDRFGNIYTSDYNNIRKVAANLPASGRVVMASPPGDTSTLTRMADGSYALRDKDGVVTYFDWRGLQTARVDANGNATTCDYDAEDRLSRITDPVGQEVVFQYSGGRLASIADPAGRVTTFAHDAAGNLTAATGPDGTVSGFSYDSNHMLIAKTTPCCTTVYHSDRHGFIDSVVSPDGSVREYSPANSRDFINDLPPGVGTKANPAPATFVREDVYTSPSGSTTRMATDKNGRLLSKIDPFGNVTTYFRNDAGLPTSVDYPNGSRESLVYDARGNLLAGVDASGNTVSFTYEPVFDNVTSVADPSGNSTTMTYDQRGNLAALTLPNGFTTSMTYDGRGLLLSAMSPLGQTAFSYDSKGNALAAVDAGGNATSFTYDPAGNITAVNDPEGRQTRYGYDQRNRVTSVTDALGHTTTFIYDEQNMTAVTDARGKETRYEYNADGYLSKETDPLGYETIFTYGLGGIVRTVTDPKGDSLVYEYDAVNRLVGKTYPDGSSVRFGFDAMGNLATADNGFSGMTFEYDGNNRMIKASTRPTAYQPGGSVLYAYDANGNRARMTDPGGGVTDYAYDEMNLVVSLTNPRAQTTRYFYDAAGRLEGRTFANGMAESVVRDRSGNVSELKICWAALQDPMLDDLFGRDRSGTITAMQGLDGSHGFVYDEVYRLVLADHPVQAQERYSYDPAGNRLSSSAASDWLYDDGNRLEGQGGVGFTYDESGNVTSRTDQVGTTAYAYDYENRLVGIDYPDGGFSAYAYDALGRRIWTDENGLITKFVYDGSNVLMEFNDNGSLRARYTFGLGVDEIISAEVPGQSGSIFYLLDHQGSVKWLADASGNLIAGYTYDSFGNVVARTGNVYNPFGYTGRVLDEASGLMYYRARYYDPSVGRFTTKDPIGFAGGSMNLYGYVSNNPVNYADPWGLWGEDVHYGMTYSWALATGMTASQAERIARADNGTDGGFGSWLPLLGDQSRHFNQSGSCSDSRNSWAETEYRRAIGYYNAGNMDAALGHLGRGLHSLQDIDPHRDWDTGMLGWTAHPDWYDSWSDPRNSTARAMTEQKSLEYLRRFFSAGPMR